MLRQHPPDDHQADLRWRLPIEGPVSLPAMTVSARTPGAAGSHARSGWRCSPTHTGSSRLGVIGDDPQDGQSRRCVTLEPSTKPRYTCAIVAGSIMPSLAALPSVGF